MKYKLPQPEDFEGEYAFQLGKAYAKTYGLLIEAVGLLELTSDTDKYSIDFTKAVVKRFLNKLS